ncbi:hypothetical protein LPA44_12730 [Halobacterium sp. KA-4]|uniref:hypothetical protein n=1 Tax=Halobacterium sp. KA-4 TaxID=2896367 RepID=UPI001E627309|nr:hypothetical protein [Halobacterium sp. KA-4]MCD2200756.1 hypothetical protein [Halobacterium sp. KA-4]
MSRDQEHEGEKAESLQEEIAAQHAEFRDTLDDLTDSSERGEEAEDSSGQE